MKLETIKKAAFVLGICALLSACGSIYEKEPVGIGPDLNELKRSPCACMLLKLPADLPDWISQNG